MNTFTPSTLNLAQETGCGPLTVAEAEKFAAVLADELGRTEPQDQHVILRVIRDLRALPSPEAAFDDIYTPDWYVPAWGESP